jgi:hypothetical protein
MGTIWQKIEGHYSPVGNDPQPEKRPGSIVANSTVAAVVFLCPVQDGLGETSQGGAESDQGRRGIMRDVDLVEVGQVSKSLENVQKS